MTYQLVLNNGVAMPALGLGVFQTPPQETVAAVAAALRTGYRHFDTAAAHGNEREVGQAIADSGVDSSEVFIETKVWISDYGYEQTLHAFEKSAGKLGVDVMPAHLDQLMKETVVPAVNQIECHPYFTQPGVQSADREHGILIQAWSPIGGITSYRGADGARSTFDDPSIAGISAAPGKTSAQVMLRWGLQRGRSVIPKSTKPGRIAENFEVFDFELTPVQPDSIDGLDKGVRGGPEPENITLEACGRDIEEA